MGLMYPLDKYLIMCYTIIKKVENEAVPPEHLPVLQKAWDKRSCNVKHHTVQVSIRHVPRVW